MRLSRPQCLLLAISRTGPPPSRRSCAPRIRSRKSCLHSGTRRRQPTLRTLQQERSRCSCSGSLQPVCALSRGPNGRTRSTAPSVLPKDNEVLISRRHFAELFRRGFLARRLSFSQFACNCLRGSAAFPRSEVTSASCGRRPSRDSRHSVRPRGMVPCRATRLSSKVRVRGGAGRARAAVCAGVRTPERKIGTLVRVTPKSILEGKK